MEILLKNSFWSLFQLDIHKVSFFIYPILALLNFINKNNIEAQLHIKTRTLVLKQTKNALTVVDTVGLEPATSRV